MNNKIKLILPKLIVITVSVGLTAFMLSLIFKLLLAGLVITAVVSIAAKIIRVKRKKQLPYKKFNEKFLTYNSDFKEKQKSAFSQGYKKNLAVIPIQ